MSKPQAHGTKTGLLSREDRTNKAKAKVAGSKAITTVKMTQIRSTVNEEDWLNHLDTANNNKATNYVTFAIPIVDHQTVLFTKKDKVLTKAILDSGCQRSDYGNIAMDSMVLALNKEDREDGKVFKSNAKFKFGDGGIHSSLRTWRLPIYISGRKRYILMDIVDSHELPPLLSLSLMKNLGLTISYNPHEQTSHLLMARR